METQNQQRKALKMNLITLVCFTIMIFFHGICIAGDDRDDGIGSDDVINDTLTKNPNIKNIVTKARNQKKPDGNSNGMGNVFIPNGSRVREVNNIFKGNRNTNINIQYNRRPFSQEIK